MKSDVLESYLSCAYDSPVGELTLAAGKDGLKGLWMKGQKYYLGTLDGPLREISMQETTQPKTLMRDMAFQKAHLQEMPHPESSKQEIPGPSSLRAAAHLKQTVAWLDDYFAGNNPAIEALALAPIGNEFRQTVWQLLCEIPYGEVSTYGEVANLAAKRLGKERMSAQATGGAVGHNPIGIIIPCHRVVGANGSLTGYAGGINKKLFLLEHEGVDTSKLL